MLFNPICGKDTTFSLLDQLHLLKQYYIFLKRASFKTYKELACTFSYSQNLLFSNITRRSMNSGAK